MSRTASPRLVGYTALAALGLVGALALRRPELAALAAPFAAFLALGLQLDREPQLRVLFELDRERALENELVEAVLTLEAETAVERLETVLVLPPGLELAEGDNPLALRLRAGEERALELRLRCARWGSYTVGDVRVRARDALGLFTWERRVERPHRLRVFPAPERLLALLPPRETQVFAGNEVARTKGDGLEFADIRPFVPGDRMRSVNWRATARRGSLVVNEFHPERGADVILFLDSFAEVRTLDESTLDHAVRAAATLSDRYLERRDRVGLVTFGGILRWLAPGSGAAQRYRLIEAILETEIEFSYAWKDVNVIPARVLTPKALVLAITPLIDPRSVGALLDLRARGHDLAVIEVSPVPFVEPGRDEDDLLAHRLWLLQREELRARYEGLGVAVARWSDDTPLAAALEGVRAFRRHASLSRR